MGEWTRERTRGIVIGGERRVGSSERSVVKGSLDTREIPWYYIHHATCKIHHVYTSSIHLSMVLSHGITPEPTEPRHCILDFWPRHTTYDHPPSHYVLAHIHSIITSAFERTTYQFNTSRQITETLTFHVASSR